jgi:hypothetical protein
MEKSVMEIAHATGLLHGAERIAIFGIGASAVLAVLIFTPGLTEDQLQAGITIKPT